MEDNELWNQIESGCSYYDLSKIYNQYCEDVLTGKITACQNIILACKRYKSWFNRDDMYMDYEDVDRRIRLISKMKHWKGKSQGQPFILSPYQQWMFASIFGWKWCKNKFRVTKKALLFIARKNGKTALAAAICLAQLLLDNNNGQEIDFVANTGAQARIGFEMTKHFADGMDPYHLIFRKRRDSIKMPMTESEVFVLNADGMTLDGRNASTFIQDEFAAAKDWYVWENMSSSQAFQQQPLGIAITSANFLLDGYPCYELRKTCISILKGEIEDDSQFAALYELDEEDDWLNDESCWIKANPGLHDGVVEIDFLRERVKTAKNQPFLEFAIKTKQFNIFCQSSDVWLRTELVKAVMEKVDIQDYYGEVCYGGVDLSATSDLTCTTVMFPPNPSRKNHPDKYVFKNYIYIPAIALDESVNKVMYKSWIDHGNAVMTGGNVVDYDWILKDQVDLRDDIYYASIAYDAYNATQYVISATNAGLPMAPYAQNLGNFNRPTKFLDMLIRSGKCVIDENPAVVWCFNNVKLRIDYNENVKPDKTVKEQKIDPVISMCEALGAYLSEGGIDIEIV